MTDNLDKDGTPENDLDNSQPQDSDLNGTHPDDTDAVSKRHQEQMEGSKQEVERMRSLLIDSEVQKAEQNAKSLLELHEKDPKTANEVAKRFNYSSYNEAKEVITKSDSNYWVQQNASPKNTETDFEAFYQKKRAEEVHDESIGKAEKIISNIKDEDKQKQARSHFDKITKWKMLTVDEAKEFAEMATLYVNKDSIRQGRSQEAMSLLGTSWLSNPWTNVPPINQDDEHANMVIREGKLVPLNSNK